jgi:carotenoid cleavage dioxygenase-like enzyme
MNVLTILILVFTIPFHNPFRIPLRETRQPLVVPPKSPFRELNGFYGLIGPNVQINNVQTLYDLFTGDGKIQGVFFQPNDSPTFVTHLVRTDKLLYETIHGRFSKNVWMTPFYVLLNKVGILPNVLGLANTALLPVGQRLFALFERDFPYELKLDIENNRVYTIKKVYLPGLSHFSGHSKFIKGVIHTIDYDVLWNRLHYVQLDPSFREHSKHSIHTHYMPLIHDFAILSDGKVLIVDAPFVWNINPFVLQMDKPGHILKFLNEGIFPKDIPVVFDKTRPTYINLYDPLEKRLKQIACPAPAFYWFHLAYTEYQGGELNIYAPMYDNVDFSSLDLNGKYRQITIRGSGKVVIKKNPLLERLNLDFPIRVGNYVVLRQIENRAIRGFVVCRGLRVIRRIRMPLGRAFCGEPAVVDVGGQPHLLGLSYDEKQRGYVSLMSIWGDTYDEIPLRHQVSIGFHSVFIPTQ